MKPIQIARSTITEKEINRKTKTEKNGKIFVVGELYWNLSKLNMITSFFYVYIYVLLLVQNIHGTVCRWVRLRAWYTTLLRIDVGLCIIFRRKFDSSHFAFRECICIHFIVRMVAKDLSTDSKENCHINIYTHISVSRYRWFSRCWILWYVCAHGIRSHSKQEKEPTTKKKIKREKGKMTTANGDEHKKYVEHFMRIEYSMRSVY